MLVSSSSLIHGRLYPLDTIRINATPNVEPLPASNPYHVKLSQVWYTHPYSFRTWMNLPLLLKFYL